MRPRVKICGITRLEDARFCAGIGADYLGFVQYPKSPRFIEPMRAAEIIEWIHGPSAVGVFVNENIESVHQTCQQAGFALVQLHGDESPDYCASIDLPVIKALRVSESTTAVDLRANIERFENVVDHILLDTYHPAAYGGTGRTFDWRVAGEAEKSASWFLSGGLKPDNILSAVTAVRPFGIDLSSGLESSPGIKDYDKVGRLFEALSKKWPVGGS